MARNRIITTIFILADYSFIGASWMVILDRLVEADWSPFFWGGDRRPEGAGYWARLEARESYRTQVFEMRCPITTRGIAEGASAKRKNETLRLALEGC